MALDKKGFGRAVLMDLSNTFYTRKHDLLIAKLYAYGLNKESLKFLHNYLSNRWHRTKISEQFSSWQELIQGLILELRVNSRRYNLFLCM